MAPEHAMLLQGTPLLHRMLLYCRGYHIYCRGYHNYSSGYHTNTGYMAIELSHIAYPMAPEHVMLLQGTPCCSRVLHLSIGCYSTAGDTTFTVRIPHLLLGYHIYCQDTTFTASAGDTTVTAVDTASTAGDTIFTAVIPHLLPGYHIYYHVIYMSMLLLQTCSAAPGYSIAP